MRFETIPAAGRVWFRAVILAALVLSACRGGGGETPLPAVTGSVPPAASALPTDAPEPTATEVALAARVNGQPITIIAYQRETARFEAGWASLGRDLSEAGDYRTQVLDELINRELVRQLAEREGLQVGDQAVEAEYQAAMQAAGGEAPFNEWLAAGPYTPEEFRAELQAALTAQALAARVVSVPETVEQVHARHILVVSEGEAQTVLALLQGGSDFADLARRYSRDLSTRLTGGELGWFYRGALAVPEVEDVAFNLQPNEFSDVVPSALGFHLVQTLERDSARALDPGVLAARRQQAFEEWLANERAGATVEVLSS